jgi:hypothetical protein
VRPAFARTKVGVGRTSQQTGYFDGSHNPLSEPKEVLFPFSVEHVKVYAISSSLWN